MKAIRINQFGGSEVLKYDDVPDLLPGAGECLIDMQAIGVNYTDVQTRKGSAPSTPLPLIPGREGSGVVARIGKEVTEVIVGDTVVYCGVTGSYAQQAVVPSDRLVKVPEGMDARTAAATLLQAMTAHYLVHSTYKLKKGDICLVHAGAGGMGSLLIQMAKRVQATVITTVSTNPKAKLAKAAGADAVINYSNSDFEAEILEVTDGKGVQVVYDAVGKTTFEKSIACLAPLGMMVLYGQASGPVLPIDPSILGNGSLFLTRPTLANYTMTREDLIWRANEVLEWARTGEIKQHIGLILPLSSAPEAHRKLEQRETMGKVLLIP